MRPTAGELPRGWEELRVQDGPGDRLVWRDLSTRRCWELRRYAAERGEFAVYRVEPKACLGVLAQVTWRVQFPPELRRPVDARGSPCPVVEFAPVAGVRGVCVSLDLADALVFHRMHARLTALWGDAS